MLSVNIDKLTPISRFVGTACTIFLRCSLCPRPVIELWMLDDDCRERKATVTRMSRIALCHGCARGVTLCDHMAPVRDNHVEETRLLTRRRYLASSLEDLLPAAYSGFTISLLLTSAVSSLNMTGIIWTNFMISTNMPPAHYDFLIKVGRYLQ